MIDKAVEAGVISQEDAALVQRAESARSDAIQVDSFALEEYQASLLKTAGDSIIDHQSHAKSNAANS